MTEEAKLCKKKPKKKKKKKPKQNKTHKNPQNQKPKHENRLKIVTKETFMTKRSKITTKGTRS